MAKKKNMKRRINIKRTLVAAALLGVVFSLGSCLKNSPYYIDFGAVGASVDLPLAANFGNGPINSVTSTNGNSYIYPASQGTLNFPVYINLASPSPLGKSVTATFALDSAYLNAYNANNGTNFVLMPDSVYTVLNGWNRTIPAGKRLDSMYVSIDLTKINDTISYVLPITIQSASLPIEQWNHLMFNPTIQ